jgi:hypothetical protein
LQLLGWNFSSSIPTNASLVSISTQCLVKSDNSDANDLGFRVRFLLSFFLFSLLSSSHAAPFAFRLNVVMEE